MSSSKNGTSSSNNNGIESEVMGSRPIECVPYQLKKKKFPNKGVYCYEHLARHNITTSYISKKEYDRSPPSTMKDKMQLKQI
jgi:hypothetical protein